MTASRGGLMVGGPGSNSFIAAGPGAYEMDGNSWLDSFSISPSFNGLPASYQIDGGPGGDMNTCTTACLCTCQRGTVRTSKAARCPISTIRAFQALDIYSNAGLFATAHGIQSVIANGSPGSTITLGDTSELNINFNVTGDTSLDFRRQ